MIDAKARTWTSPSTGIVLKLTPVSSALVNKIQSDRRGKPSMPLVTVNYARQGDPPQYAQEPNPEDLIYKECLEDWRNGNQTRMSMYVFGMGVDIDVPQSFIDGIAEYDDTKSPSELRYFYLTAIIPAPEWGDLTNAILSQTVPTEAGIADATAGFPSNS